MIDNEITRYIGIRLPAGMVERLKEEKKKTGWSVTLIIRTLIERYLK